MKVLFVETVLSGHRKAYHKTLIEYIGGENSILITPEQELDVDCSQIIDDSVNLRPRTISDYTKWIRFIKVTADKYKATVIHFLDGDLLYRFCGYRLGQLKNYKTIVTFHHVADDLIHNLSMKLIAKKITYGVVHTENIQTRFSELKNIKLIDYPYFPNEGGKPSKEKSRKYYKIADDKIVLLVLGGTRYEKGLDILFEALKGVQAKNVEILIVGKEDYFKREDIEKFDTGYAKVNLNLRPINDSEWNMALAACDYVVLPYRKSFAGASGPLTEAIWFEKPVIGKSDGSIGDMIQKYGLGWTFEAEDCRDLSRVIDDVILQGNTQELNAEAFIKRISRDIFSIKYKNLYIM